MSQRSSALAFSQVLSIVQLVRAAVLTLILSVSLGSYLLQPSFINWSLLGPFYLVLILAYLFQVGWLIYLRDESKQVEPGGLFLFGFVADSLLLSALIHYSGVNQSLFLFLHLLNILLAGIVSRTKGAILVALVTSVSFSLATLFGPELKPLQNLFMLALNNIAFFSVAGLSGYLAEQLNTVKSELKKTDLSLQSVEEFNRILLENMPAGLVTFDADGHIINSNPSAKNLFGISEKNFFHLLPDLNREKVEGFQGDVRFAGNESDGSEAKILGLNIKRFESAELNQSLYIALVQDFTEMRRLEFSSRQNEKLAAIGGLAAGIAHEIRNPLAGISGSIELLSQTTTNDDDKKLMKIILREIDRLNNLITEFLEYSRPEQAPTQTVDLSALVNEVMDLMATNKQVRADVQVQKDIIESALILGHKDKLKQAFLNIIINAYQAMQDVGLASLKLRVEKNSEFVTVRIKDSGCGMSEQTRKRMFEPFHTTKSKGTGLGLAVTHKILEGHRAQIFVESEKGIGTEFVLHFPLAQIEIK